MGLVNLTTDLKSLKFGQDRLDGGNSGQPYIKNPILSKPGQLSQASSDFLLRGGLKAPLDALTDVARLTKWFFDFKNPKVGEQKYLGLKSCLCPINSHAKTTILIM